MKAKRAHIALKIIILQLIFSTNINAESYTFLVFGGKTGWIGQKMITLLSEQGHTALPAESRLEDREAVNDELTAVQPDFVINAAGVTGRPNIDWCEDHQEETIRANVIGALNLADLCTQHGLHLTHFGTGCIYEYDDTHQMYSGIGFTEEERPNFEKSFYSKSKIMVDTLLGSFKTVLNLRVRMPISDDLHPRNFITKITKYARVINIPNSMTVLHDLLPAAIELTLKKKTGTYNFTNPGTISHNEILDLYAKYIDPEFTYANFTLAEQDKILKAGRSNNELDSTKLLKECPSIPHIQASIIGVFERMQRNLKLREE